MRRKNLLFTVFTICILLFVTACSSGSSSSASESSGGGKSHTLSFSHFWPSHHIVHTDVLEPFTEEVEEATDGRISVELYPLNQLGNADEQYDLASNGTADIALGVHGYTPGKFPLTSVSDLPFIAKSSEEGSAIISQLFDEFDELKDEHGDVTPLWVFAGEENQILSAEKPVKTVEDLKGMKIRSPSPLMSQMLEEIGAVPVSMPINDIYESLNKGVIDAAMAGISTINDMKLYEVVKHISITNVSSSSLFVVMNTDMFNSLSEEDQETLLNIAKEGSKMSGQALDRASQLGIDKANEEGIEIYEFPEEEIEKWKKATKPIIDQWIEEMEGKGLPGKEIYERAVELGSSN